MKTSPVMTIQDAEGNTITNSQGMLMAIAKLASVATAFPTCLRSRSAMAGVDVDEAAGIIRNVRVMSLGAAKGHGFNLDETSLAQALALLTAEPTGAKMHFTHPEQHEDGSFEDQLGAIVGRLKNCRLEGDAIFGDVHLGDYASSLPGLGDARKYLLGIAKSDPAAIGLSCVFAWEPEVVPDATGKPKGIVARISTMYQVDFVGDPAANPNGLLSTRAQSETPVVRMMNQILRGETVS